VGGHNVTARVAASGRPARLDRYDEAVGDVADAARASGIRSAAGVPIAVEGRLWGAVLVASRRSDPLPADIESRLAGFTELAGTAVANAQARVELRGFAREQAALRRVATQVARPAPPNEVFAAVTAEVGLLVGCDFTLMNRYDPDGMVTVVAVWGRARTPPGVAVGYRSSYSGRNISTAVMQTGRPARIDDYGPGAGPGPAAFVAAGMRSVAGTPISVAGRLWGVMIALQRDGPLPADTESRLAGFTELVATAVANAESQAQLTASRARIVATADHTRRRIERDLHDGAQQRLVSLALELRTARAVVPADRVDLAERVDDVAAGLTGVLDELRDITRGIHPAVLAEGGLVPALRVLARRSAVPVRLDLGVGRRLPEQVELAAYYAASEALTNTAKHAGASSVALEAELIEAEGIEAEGIEAGLIEGATGSTAGAATGAAPVLRLCVRDDGRGGAGFAGGSGLVGLRDRVEALGGSMTLLSRPGEGTSVEIRLPVDAPGATAARARPA
jgi:signal transduction histidine kinase